MSEGKKCFDLLSRTRNELTILDGADGRTNVIGAVESQANSREDLLEQLQQAVAMLGMNEGKIWASVSFS